MCGAYPVKADDDYTLQSVYSVEPFSGTSIMPQISMPEVNIYPTVSSSPVENTLVLTDTTRYLLTEQLRYEESLHNTYITPSVIQGTRDGYITAYAQRIIYTNTESDMYEAHLNIVESKGGSGVVTIYAQKNDEWVQVAVDNFENTYSTGDLVPSSAITGWRFDVVYTLNNRFRFFNPNYYVNGYKLNSIGFNIVSPTDEQQEALNDIKENTSRTNGLLGTIKTAIDNIKNVIDDVKNAIDDVISAIADLPDTILNGLKELFIPDDFTSLLTDNINDLTDSLGFLGFPLAFVNDLITTVVNADSLVLAVSVPTIGSPWGTLFPGYTRSNILYWVNYKCFNNLGSSTMFSNLLSILGLSYNSSIVSVIHSFTNIALFLALLHLAVNKYNDLFGTDIDAGGDDD